MCNNGFQLPVSQAKCLKYCETKIFDSQQLGEIIVVTEQMTFTFSPPFCVFRK